MMNMTDVEEINSEVRGMSTEELVNLVEGKNEEMPGEKNGQKGINFLFILALILNECLNPF